MLYASAGNKLFYEKVGEFLVWHLILDDFIFNARIYSLLLHSGLSSNVFVYSIV